MSKKLFVITGGLIMLDQFSKILALFYLNSPVAIIGDYFYLALQINRHLAFSIPLPSLLIIPLTLFLLAAGVILAYLYLDGKNTPVEWALVLIYGGALGNLVDRFFRAGVVDFIKIWFWPAFNLADIFITVGLLLLIYVLESKKTKVKK